MTSRPFITFDSASADKVPRSLPSQGRTMDFNRESVRKQRNQSQDVAAIKASFARQGFLSTKQDATSDSVTGVSPERAGHKAAVNDELGNPVPRTASPDTMKEDLFVSRDPEAKQAPKDSGGDSSHRSQSKTSFGSSVRSSERATNDSFKRFQARLNGQRSSLPDPTAKLTESTRKKLTKVTDGNYNRTAHLSGKSASVGPSIVPPSTSNEGLAQNFFANPQAVKAELSTPNLTVDQPRPNPQAVKTDLSIRNLNIDHPQPNPQAVKTELSTRNLNIDQPRQQAKASVQIQSNSKKLSGRDDFNTLYRTKYKGIRSLFDSMHGSTEASPREDQLFRRLGEAYVMEDTDEFENVYNELLGELASSIAPSKLVETGLLTMQIR